MEDLISEQAANNLSEKRDATLDILRALGLLLIILAHCNPPNWLFQLRNFDVPLMVVVSAATFTTLYSGKTIDLKQFYKKRLIKLILPAWYFLTFFFVSLFLYFFITSTSYPFSTKEIVTSYLFYSGIGYVWILRIFIIIALLTPPILYFKEHIKNLWVYYGTILAIYIAYEAIVVGLDAMDLPKRYHEFLITVILPVLPFAAIYAYGVGTRDLSSKWLCCLSLIFLGVFIGFAIPLYIEHGYFVQTQTAKYPPTLYYISYALLMINIAVLILRTKVQSYLPQNMLTWLSINSLWLYLWHIYGLYIWDNNLSTPGGQLIQSIVKFMFVLTFAASITATQNILSKKLFTRNSIHQ